MQSRPTEFKAGRPDRRPGERKGGIATHYFAYGSNMDRAQMKDRCPSARFVGRAVLRDHTLAFTRESLARGCGVADVVAIPGDHAWGVVYTLDEADLRHLDRCEGYQPGRRQNNYRRVERTVYLDDSDAAPLRVHLYVAEHQADPPLPNAAYLGLLLAGARHWGLPDDYIRRLEAVVTEG